MPTAIVAVGEAERVEAVVERHPLDFMAELVARGVPAQVLKFWRRAGMASGCVSTRPDSGERSGSRSRSNRTCARGRARRGRSTPNSSHSDFVAVDPVVHLPRRPARRRPANVLRMCPPPSSAPGTLLPDPGAVRERCLASYTIKLCTIAACTPRSPVRYGYWRQSARRAPRGAVFSEATCAAGLIIGSAQNGRAIHPPLCGGGDERRARRPRSSTSLLETAARRRSRRRGRGRRARSRRTSTATTCRRCRSRWPTCSTSRASASSPPLTRRRRTSA